MPDKNNILTPEKYRKNGSYPSKLKEIKVINLMFYVHSIKKLHVFLQEIRGDGPNIPHPQ
jgi:hypothetical protein